jgi:hypothetical protein
VYMNFARDRLLAPHQRPDDPRDRHTKQDGMSQKLLDDHAKRKVRVGGVGERHDNRIHRQIGQNAERHTGGQSVPGQRTMTKSCPEIKRRGGDRYGDVKSCAKDGGLEPAAKGLLAQ